MNEKKRKIIFLRSSIALFIVTAIIVKISSLIIVSPTVAMYIPLIAFIMVMFGTSYSLWQWMLRKVPFLGLRKFYWKMVVSAYKMKLEWIGDVSPNSWWGIKKREMERGLKEAKDELIKLTPAKY